MNFFSTLCNNTETQNILDYVRARKTTYKLTIQATPNGATVLLNGVRQNVGYYQAEEKIDYVVSEDGYITQRGTITMSTEEKTEAITLIEVSRR